MREPPSKPLGQTRFSRWQNAVYSHPAFILSSCAARNAAVDQAVCDGAGAEANSTVHAARRFAGSEKAWDRFIGRDIERPRLHIRIDPAHAVMNFRHHCRNVPRSGSHWLGLLIDIAFEMRICAALNGAVPFLDTLSKTRNIDLFTGGECFERFILLHAASFEHFLQQAGARNAHRFDAFGIRYRVAVNTFIEERHDGVGSNFSVGKFIHETFSGLILHPHAEHGRSALSKEKRNAHPFSTGEVQGAHWIQSV